MNSQFSPKEQYEQTKKDHSRNKKQSSFDAATIKLLVQRVFSIVFFIAVIIGIGWFGVTKLGVGHFDPTSTCLTAETYHVHPHLKIIINGQEQTIPANTGGAPCFLPIHTHDSSGSIHVENAVQFDATLAEFFTIWKKTFTRDQILDSHVDATHEIVMTVDGQPSDAYENLILKDKQDIVIEYREKK